MNFLKFFETKSNQNISVSIDNYKFQLWEAIKEILDYSEADNVRLKGFVLNSGDIEKALHQVGYQHYDNAVIILATKDYNKIGKLIEDLMAFQREVLETGDYKKVEVIRGVIKNIWDYESQLGGYKKYTKADAKKQHQEILKTTQDHMNAIIANIKNAISRMAWNNTPLVISPNGGFNHDSGWMHGTDSAEVTFGEDNNELGTGAPQFSYFQDGSKVIIDDVLEAGDDEFFHDPKVEADYFGLVQELRNPGGKSKIVTVYTARPLSDHEIYINAAQIPSNIFVTTSFNGAEGIALDLGSSEPREVWKIRIDNKYLLNTLDTGSVREYQVVGTGMIPVKSISLA